MRFLLGAELGRAAPTRTVRDDGRMSDVRRCNARGAQHGSATVGERLKGSFACSASMNGVTLMQPSGVPPTPPNPRSPEGFRNPAQPAPEPMPWAGFSLGRRRPANLERPTLCNRPWAESAVVAGMLAGFVWARFSPPTAARPPPCGIVQSALRGL